MKLRLLGLCALLSPFALPVYAENAESTLKAQLQQITSFQASFKQKVVDPEGELVHQAEGKLALAKPSKLNWQQFFPEEDIIVSNGTTIWYYSPFIEQVTIMNAQEAIAQSPFILLADDNPENWQQYQISEKDGGYLLSPKQDDAQSNFWVKLEDKAGKPQVVSFAIIDSTGQTSSFTLADYQASPKLSDADFNFSVPEGVMVDDQR